MDIDTPSSTADKTSSQQTRLANAPPPKLPRRPKNSKVHKRPINRNQALNRGTTSSSSPSPPSSSPSSSAVIIYVGTKSPFMSIITRVRKALNNGPGGLRSNSAGKGLTLAARIAALNNNNNHHHHNHNSSSAAAAGGGGDDAVKHHEVLVRGTGRAMAKTLNVAAYFQDQRDTRVSVRTMTLEAVDDVVVDEDGAEAQGGFAAEEETRVRMVNCLEVGVSLR